MPQFKVTIDSVIADIPQETLMCYEPWREFQKEMERIAEEENCYLKLVEEEFDPKNFRYTMRFIKCFM